MTRFQMKGKTIYLFVALFLIASCGGVINATNFTASEGSEALVCL